jgi:Aldo/keto reductase family
MAATAHRREAHPGGGALLTLHRRRGMVQHKIGRPTQPVQVGSRDGTLEGGQCAIVVSGAAACGFRFSLGASFFGTRIGRDDATAILYRALDLGVNVVDTAESYLRPEPLASEAVLGQILAGVRRELVLRTHEYVFPFNYGNVTVERVWRGGERHGLELFPIKQTDPERGSSPLPADSITIVETQPIVRVAIVGSACTPPGWVTLEVEPVAGVRRRDETIADLPLRFQADNLWGMHLRVDLLRTREGDDEGRPRWGHTKSHYRELPVAGMSCAVFEIPAARGSTPAPRSSSCCRSR